MGLFSSLFKASKEDIVNLTDSREAYFAILYAAMAADGTIDDEEIDALCQYVVRSPYFAGFPVTDVYRKIAALQQKIGIGPIVSVAMPKIDSEKKSALFAMVSDLILSDGIISPKEEMLLEDLQKGLDIPSELATKIVEVLLLKNKV